MTKTFKPSEINILQRQVVPTDKINLTLNEVIKEVRSAFKDVRFQVLISQTERERYTLNLINQDPELFNEQYREAESQAKIKSLLSEQLNDPYVETKLEQAFIDSTRKSIKKWRDYF